MQEYEGHGEEYEREDELDDFEDDFDLDSEDDGVSFEDDGYVEFQVPEIDEQEDPRAWYAHLPRDNNGELDWDDLFLIEGKLPTTTLSRRAMMLVSKKLKKEPFLAMKESTENLLRLCINRIDGNRVSHVDLRGEGLDTHLSPKQQQMVGEYFNRLTSATEDEVEAFLKMTRPGRRPSR
tara:strand:+ start:640 stop:1176 length:537 start_codon:yes stop_codon:yes gene_type:complete